MQHIWSMSQGRGRIESQKRRALWAHGQELERDARGPLHVLLVELAEDAVGADAIGVQRAPGHKPDLQVGLLAACISMQARSELHTAAVHHGAHPDNATQLLSSGGLCFVLCA